MINWQLDEHSLQELRDLARDDDPLHVFSQSPEDCAQQVSDALSGIHTTTRQRLARRLGTRHTHLDRLTAELIAREGVDPLCLYVLSGKLESFGVMRPDRVDDDAYHTFVERRGRSFSGHVTIAPGVVWRFGEGPTFEGVPETVASAMEGRTLKGIMSHPVVDGSSKRITGIRREPFGDVVYTHIDLEPSCVTLTPDELLAIEIRQMEAA